MSKETFSAPENPEKSDPRSQSPESAGGAGKPTQEHLEALARHFKRNYGDVGGIEPIRRRKKTEEGKSDPEKRRRRGDKRVIILPKGTMREQVRDEGEKITAPSEIRENSIGQDLTAGETAEQKPISQAELETPPTRPSLKSELQDPKFQEVLQRVLTESKHPIRSTDRLAKFMGLSLAEAKNLIQRLKNVGAIERGRESDSIKLLWPPDALKRIIKETENPDKGTPAINTLEGLNSEDPYIKAVAILLNESRKGRPFSQKGLLMTQLGLSRKEADTLFDRFVADGLIKKDGPTASLLPQSMAAFLEESLARPPAAKETETPAPRITKEIASQVESEPEVIPVAPEPAPTAPPETAPEKPELDEQFIRALQSVFFSQDATEAQLKKTINVDDKTASDLIKRMQSIGAVGEWRKGTRKVLWSLQQLENEIQIRPKDFEKLKETREELAPSPPLGERIVFNGEIPPAGGPETPPSISKTGPLEVVAEEVPLDEIPPGVAERLRQAGQAADATIEASESPSRQRNWWQRGKRYLLPFSLSALLGVSGGYWTAKNKEKISETFNRLTEEEPKVETQKERVATEPKQFITQEEVEALRKQAAEALAKADSAREEMKTFRTWAETPAVEEPQVGPEAETRETPPPSTFETASETPLSPPGEEVRSPQPKKETPEKTAARKIPFTREVVGRSGLNQSQYEEIKNINVREFLKNYSDSKKYGRYGQFTSVIQMGTLREKSQLTQSKSTLANTLIKIAGPEGLKDFEEAMTVDELLKFLTSEESKRK